MRGRRVGRRIRLNLGFNAWCEMSIDYGYYRVVRVTERKSGSTCA